MRMKIVITKIGRILGMTKKWIALALLLVACAVVGLIATHNWSHLLPGGQQARSADAEANSIGKRKILYWYDPMHPAYTSSKPGIAPDCGMELVPKYAEEQSAAKPVQGTVVISDNQQSQAGVRTAVVQRTHLTREITTTAQIVADETRIEHVHVRVSGFINRVFVNSIGQEVRKGEPLFTLYSPDLVSTQEEYLIAKRSKGTLGNAPFQEIAQGAQSLLESARQRLKQWEISDEQIRQLDQTGKVINSMTIYSPVSGFVTDRKVFANASINPDTEAFTVSDLSSVWALVDIFENEVPFVHVGNRVTFTLASDPGKNFAGTISFIYPTVDPQTRTVKARVQLLNRGYWLKPQMFAAAQVHIDYGMQIAVPREAVLDSGSEQQVYVVQDGGSFAPRRVTLGASVGDQVVILDGLKQGETIVTSGNFLVDSESRLKSAPRTGVTP